MNIHTEKDDTVEKGPPDLHQRPLNMGQRSDVPLPEVAFMP